MILLYIVIAVVITGLMWGVYRYNLDEKIINIVKRRKFIILIVFVGVLLSFWTLFCELQGPIANKNNGIEVVVSKSDPHGVEGTVTYNKLDKYSYLCSQGRYKIEKRTMFGWKKWREEPAAHDAFSTYISGSGGIRNGETKFVIPWEEELPSGRYRLRYSLYYYNPSAGANTTQRVDDFYIMFRVEN